jgi:hypothetical protein
MSKGTIGKMVLMLNLIHGQGEDNMKKIFYVIFCVTVFFGCEKEVETPNIQEVWVSGYTAFSSESTYKKNNIKFLFFKLKENESVQVEKKTFSGSLVDYMKLTDENYELLRKEEKIKLQSGSTITANFTVICGEKDTTYKILSLPVGKYYVASIYNGIVYLSGVYISDYALKYAGKYINVEYNYTPTVIDVVIPADTKHYGCIDWVRWNEKFPYDF